MVVRFFPDQQESLSFCRLLRFREFDGFVVDNIHRQKVEMP